MALDMNGDVLAQAVATEKETGPLSLDDYAVFANEHGHKFLSPKLSLLITWESRKI